MTYDEHKTRAMLMGARYIAACGWYVLRGRGEKAYRLDAVTLEVISDKEKTYRFQTGKLNGIWYPHD